MNVIIFHLMFNIFIDPNFCNFIPLLMIDFVNVIMDIIIHYCLQTVEYAVS